MIEEKSVSERVNVYYDLYVPENRHGSTSLIIALHGYEGNKESMMAKVRKVNSQDFIIASLQGPNSFLIRDEASPRRARVGFGWMMQYKAEETIELHHRVVQSIIEEAGHDYAVGRAPVFLIGFSQSVSLNYRFAFTHPGLIRGIVAVCGGIPGDWEEPKYHESDTDVLILAGETDEFYPLERTRTFKNALQRRAKSVEFRSFAEGHVFSNDTLPIINEWLLARIGIEPDGD